MTEDSDVDGGPGGADRPTGPGGADPESADGSADGTPGGGDGRSSDGPDADGETAAPTDAAAPETTGPRSLSPRVRLQWGLRALVGVVALTLGTAYLAAAVEAIPPWAAVVVGALALAVGAAWVHRRYQVWVYELRADALYLERGVLTHVRTIAPYVRIQHVDTQRGPLERWLGLSTLVVYTAGSRGADVSIPGLTPAEARDLQAQVKELAIAAEGGDAV